MTVWKATGALVDVRGGAVVFNSVRRWSPCSVDDLLPCQPTVCNMQIAAAADLSMRTRKGLVLPLQVALLPAAEI